MPFTLEIKFLHAWTRLLTCAFPPAMRRPPAETRTLVSVLLLFVIFALAGCQTGRQATDAAKRYELTGRVVAVDVAKRRATVAHDEIPGYMDAMTMPLAVKDTEMLQALTPGDKISGFLVVENNVSWLEILSVAKAPEPIPGATPGPEAKPGDDAPDVKLVNQDGHTVRLSQYRGQTVLLTFIYTRCPLPDYCILMSENFGQVSKAIAARPDLRGKVRLLSISFDPEFDRPATLKTYGQTYMSRFTKTDFNLWTFATGEADEIRRFAGFFGLVYRQEDKQIVHSLRTIAVNPQGKVEQVFSGNEWKPEDAVAVLERTATAR
jgi:protein SCO1/2